MAVRLVLAGSSPPKYDEVEEYPASIGELRDIVLESLVTDGSSYKMFVDDREVEESDLGMHAQAKTTLHVCIVLPTPMVMLKLLGTNPLQTWPLKKFPLSLEKLDDEVSKNLVRHGSFALKVNNENLTNKVYNSYMEARHPIEVHVVPSASMQSYTSSRHSSTSWENLESITEQKQLPADVVESLRRVKGNLCNIKNKWYTEGTNLMKMAAQRNLAHYEQLRDSVEGYRKSDPQLAKQADADLQLMQDHFTSGVSDLLCTHHTIALMAASCSQIACGVQEGNGEMIRSSMQRLIISSQEMQGKCSSQVKALKQAVTDLKEQREAHSEAAGNHATKGQVGVGGGVSCAALGCAAFATDLAVFGPLGILVAAGAIAYRFSQWSSSSSEEALAKILHEVQTNMGHNLVLWKGIEDNVAVAKSRADTMGRLGDDDKKVLVDNVNGIVTQLRSVQQGMDEYLVYMSEQHLIPVACNIVDVVGKEQYKVLKRVMDEEKRKR